MLGDGESDRGRHVSCSWETFTFRMSRNILASEPLPYSDCSYTLNRFFSLVFLVNAAFLTYSPFKLLYIVHDLAHNEFNGELGTVSFTQRALRPRLIPRTEFADITTQPLEMTSRHWMDPFVTFLPHHPISVSSKRLVRLSGTTAASNPREV